MPRLIAFLRAINVGGHVVKMDALRKQFEALGLTDVETFIASGNVLFTSRTANLAAIEKKIETRLEKALGYEVRTFVRTEAEVCAIARYKPFPAGAIAGAGALCVGFLADPLGPAAVKTLLALKTEIDDFHVQGKEVYWLCTKRQHESTFSNVRFEKQVKASVTFRGVNTVARLAARCAQE
ncbi:MAG TPA: DUF1697 domain-containing protein [Vicinamibacterales bacterium]|jgi:uncharacterized protein (DUF1697 family)